jgi:hypothetical protein
LEARQATAINCQLYRPTDQRSIFVDVCDDETRHALMPAARQQQMCWACVQRSAAVVALFQAASRTARKISPCPRQVRSSAVAQ